MAVNRSDELVHHSLMLLIILMLMAICFVLAEMDSKAWQEAMHKKQAPITKQ